MADEHAQDSEVEQKQCVCTADEQKRCVGTADEHERAWGQESEGDHERCLVCLSTAEVSKLRDISEQLQDQSPTTTTTYNNDGVRDRYGLGDGKCMSYYNVDGVEICKSIANTTSTTSTTKRRRHDDDNDDINDDMTARRATLNAPARLDHPPPECEAIKTPA